MRRSEQPQFDLNSGELDEQRYNYTQFAQNRSALAKNVHIDEHPYRVVAIPIDASTRLPLTSFGQDRIRLRTVLYTVIMVIITTLVGMWTRHILAPKIVSSVRAFKRRFTRDTSPSVDINNINEQETLRKRPM